MIEIGLVAVNEAGLRASNCVAETLRSEEIGKFVMGSQRRLTADR
jgi:hypothetical protein